jgi:hypothetical protein
LTQIFLAGAHFQLAFAGSPLLQEVLQPGNPNLDRQPCPAGVRETGVSRCSDPELAIHTVEVIHVGLTIVDIEASAKSVVESRPKFALERDRRVNRGAAEEKVVCQDADWNDPYEASNSVPKSNINDERGEECRQKTEREQV